MSYFEKEAKARRRVVGESIKDIAAALQVDETRIERALLGDHVVRVVLYKKDAISSKFLQSMEVAGFLKLHRRDGDICFDILPPLEADSKEWAKKLADYMAPFGFNAVVAPRWADDDNG